MQTRRSAHRGFFLIEALVAIAIFSLGILGMVSIAGISINAQSDARYRTDAASLADDLASRIVLNVNRVDLVSFQNSLHQYELNPTGADCVFGPQPFPVANADAIAWLANVTSTGPGLPGLPGASATTQQVVVDTTAAGFNRVQITVCWRGPSDAAMRHHTLVTYVNGLL